ncbi:MAG TPA: hypothetical protein VK610_06375, partial [Rhodothermales bacterium]|nr:hypothetical protein [Rhodothermales bacterium]
MEPTPTPPPTRRPSARPPAPDAPRGWRRMLTFPSPYTVLMAVIVLAAIATWVFPSGAYSTLTYDGDARTFVVASPDTTLTYPATQATLDRLGIRADAADFVGGAISKPVAVPGTYRRTPPTPQGALEVLRAPIEGIYDAVDVILFVLIIGGFIGVFNRSGAFDAGIGALARKLKGRESWLIVIVTTLMALGGTTFGMAEETIAFYPLLVPVFLAAGYDSLVPLAVILGGSHIGGMASTTNPFATVIASEAAGVSWDLGLGARVAVFVVGTGLLIAYILRYARRVKADPSASLTRRRPVVSADPEDSTVPSAAPAADAAVKAPPPMTLRVALALTLFALTFVVMIVGVTKLGWWFPEMTALFLGAAVVVALVEWPGEKQFVTSFIHGAKDLLGVAFVIGIARGVTLVMNHGGLSGTIIEATSGWVAGMPPVLFVIALLAVFFALAFFIPSSSGIAVLTM